MPRLDMADLRAAVKKVQVDDEVMQLHTAFIHRVLNMVDGAAAVLSNGRVGEPFAPYFKLSAFFNSSLVHSQPTRALSRKITLC